jgi:hypothetical protein
LLVIFWAYFDSLLRDHRPLPRARPPPGLEEGLGVAVAALAARIAELESCLKLDPRAATAVAQSSSPARPATDSAAAMVQEDERPGGVDGSEPTDEGDALASPRAEPSIWATALDALTARVGAAVAAVRRPGPSAGIPPPGQRRGFAAELCRHGRLAVGPTAKTCSMCNLYKNPELD